MHVMTKGFAMLAEMRKGFIYNLLMEQATIWQSNFNGVRQVRQQVDFHQHPSIRESRH